MQIDAIKSGVNHGLTMVVGPPGTGKTDTAVQIVNLIFHNNPEQKMLLIAHSNQALNDLFEKIVKLDIPERYLVRLGRGAEDLDIHGGSGRDYSKYGRVDFMLQRRLELLQIIEKLANAVGVDGSNASYTCETAKFFFLQHVVSNWERFLDDLQQCRKNKDHVYKVLKKPVGGAGGSGLGSAGNQARVGADGEAWLGPKRKKKNKGAASRAA